MTEAAPARPPKPLYSNVSQAVPSPCTSVCRLDEQKVCLGCFRHVEDIREWRSADDERRRVICAQAQQRKAQV
ncbi:DUF1289 domain-containing protein [Pseudomonas sp. 6D_7.1_Bac1]|uniref:DUF1289 domain-containing protein n=1 Tax=Pseudomonas sp. 6D_7.1_Bac1 TaxID=2971615 RepID=UPI0021CA6CAC|nr:DUF1289 domain-containing protein [Pseudomonas sp. 6D_7.1_Bac1]MCU1749770.1 DUF1289 domain-containing protein [Pseudomonas sp. 6D_7.1_Bac1]